MVPLSSCDTALTAVYGPDDACSNVVRGIVTQTIDDGSELYEGDCFNRFQSFATECSRALDDNFVSHAQTY